MWDRIVGHEIEKRFLQNLLTGERKTPSLLFYGPEGIGKKKLALEFAKSFLCLEDPLTDTSCKSCRAFGAGSHPDLLLVEPGGNTSTISIGQIRKLSQQALYAPVLSPYKVCIIEQADHMQETAQNALLKLLEEPPDYWLFILVADRGAALLPTILSRVVQIQFYPLTLEQTRQAMEQALLTQWEVPESLEGAEPGAVQAQWLKEGPVLSALAGGSPGKAVDLFRLEALTLRQQVLDLLEKVDEDQLMVYLKGLDWLDKAATAPKKKNSGDGEKEPAFDRREPDFLRLELLLLLLRDGLLLQAGVAAPLYNEDIRKEAALCFAGWKPSQLRRTLDLVQESRLAIARFVPRRLVFEALLLEIQALRKEM